SMVYSWSSISLSTSVGKGARSPSISGKSSSRGSMGTYVIHVCVNDLFSAKSFQVVIKPTATVHLILSSSPAMKSVLKPPPDNPQHPMFEASTSLRELKMSSATLSSPKNTAGHVVPAQNNDF